MLYRFSIVFLIGLCLVACSSGSMQEESVPVIRFKPDEEGVQKVFGTLDLFVSLLETEIKYPILQGGILPFWTPSFERSAKGNRTPVLRMRILRPNP